MDEPASYKVTIQQKPTYLHAVVTGLNEQKNVSAYLDEILRECMLRGSFRVLIEERLEGPRLAREAVLNIVREGVEPALGFIDALAYVDVNAEGDLMKLAGKAASEHHLPVRVFNTVDEAQHWIQDFGLGNTRS